MLFVRVWTAGTGMNFSFQYVILGILDMFALQLLCLHDIG
jgi:hypothetical protein